MRMWLMLGVVVGLAAFAVLAEPAGTAFTYQGRLDLDGSPVNDTVDLTFRLYDAGAGGSQIGPSLLLPSTPVSDGVFSVTLDFQAGAFSSELRWLEVQVGGNVLTPRQPLRPAPVAQVALQAAPPGFQSVLYVSATGADFATLGEALAELPVNGPLFSTLIWVGPGTYNEPNGIRIPPNTTVQGAGAGLTRIVSGEDAGTPTGAVNAATIRLAAGARLRDVSVRNSGGVGTIAAGVRIDAGDANTVVEQVEVLADADDAAGVYGVWVVGGAPVLRESKIQAAGDAAADKDVVALYCQGQGSLSLVPLIERCELRGGDSCVEGAGVGLRASEIVVQVNDSEICGAYRGVVGLQLGIVQIDGSRLSSGASPGAFLFETTGAAAVRVATSAVLHNGNTLAAGSAAQSARCVHCFSESYQARNASCE